jgi:hypothetical protein
VDETADGSVGDDTLALGVGDALAAEVGAAPVFGVGAVV